MPRAELSEILRPGESPYFGMFHAGRVGYDIDEVQSYCMSCGIPLREKDIQNWKEGAYKFRMSEDMFEAKLAEARKRPGSTLNPVNLVNKREIIESANRLIVERHGIIENIKLDDLPLLPDGWEGCERRFFPCTKDNRPMCQWGWKPADPESGRPVFDPNLMTKVDAKALSPVGWVGQNMLYQPFIVLDIDGEGHGVRDEAVIQFGNLFKDMTMAYTSPNKPGSFHLYFKTRHLVPVKHFPHAKLDLMGNAVNAAVYLKDKQWNGVPMAELTPQIWDATMRYQAARKEW